MSGLLIAVCRAVAPALTGGGTTTAEVGGKILSAVWEWWGAKTREADRRRELEEVARLTAEQFAAAIRSAVGAGAPAGLHAYLLAFQAQVRRASRRPSDPTGLTVSAHLPLSKAEDLGALLPPRLPRFAPADKVPGTDLELVQLLGIGGFGEVWKAKNPYLPSEPPVALKFCLDPEAAASLRREAKLLDAVRREGKHPGVVDLRRTYLSADPPFLEYEWVDGGDLGGFVLDRVRRSGAVPPDEAAKIVRRLAEVAAFAHAKGIVHRDLKPANVLTQNATRADGKREVRFKVTDFGIGSITAEAATRAGARPGTLTAGSAGSYTAHYASPEQERGADPDPRDDVHALGVIWYQMLCGDLNVPAPRGPGWKKRFAEKGVPAGHVALIEECVSSERADRPADGAALVARLRADEPPAEVTAEEVADEPPPPPKKPKPPKPGPAPEPGALGDPAAWPRYEGLLSALRSLRSDRNRLVWGRSWVRWGLSTLLAVVVFGMVVSLIGYSTEPRYARVLVSEGRSGYGPYSATAPQYREYLSYENAKAVGAALMLLAVITLVIDRVTLALRRRRGAIPRPAATGFLTYLVAVFSWFAFLLVIGDEGKFGTSGFNTLIIALGLGGLLASLYVARRVCAARLRERIHSTPVAVADEYEAELATLVPGGVELREPAQVDAAITAVERAYELEAPRPNPLAGAWHRLFAPL